MGAKKKQPAQQRATVAPHPPEREVAMNERELARSSVRSLVFALHLLLIVLVGATVLLGLHYLLALGLVVIGSLLIQALGYIIAYESALDFYTIFAGLRMFSIWYSIEALYYLFLFPALMWVYLGSRGAPRTAGAISIIGPLILVAGSLYEALSGKTFRNQDKALIVLAVSSQFLLATIGVLWIITRTPNRSNDPKICADTLRRWRRAKLAAARRRFRARVS